MHLLVYAEKVRREKATWSFWICRRRGTAALQEKAAGDAELRSCHSRSDSPGARTVHTVLSPGNCSPVQWMAPTTDLILPLVFASSRLTYLPQKVTNGCTRYLTSLELSTWGKQSKEFKGEWNISYSTLHCLDKTWPNTLQTPKWP